MPGLRWVKRISQDRHKRTCCCRSGSYKILIQEPPKSLPQWLPYKHRKDMAPARSSRKELLEKILPILPWTPQKLLTRTCAKSWSSQDLLTRTCTRSRKDFRQNVIRICAAPSHKELYKTWVKIFKYDAPWAPYQVPREAAKSAPRHNESDPARTNFREGYASHVKLRNAPHRERSNTPTHTQSDDRVVGATSKLAPHHSPLQEARGLRVLFFNQGLQSTAPATKMSKGKLSPRLCASLRNGNRHLRRGPEPRPGQPAAQTLCEPAQSKWTWTSHKGSFVRELTAKTPRPLQSTLI